MTHRVSIEDLGATGDATEPVVVTVAGAEVARSRKPKVLRETGYPDRHYFPPEDVDFDRLEPSDTRTHCPFKGEASYWSFVAEDGTRWADVGWSYQEPIPEAEEIRGHLAFHGERVDIALQR
ncbi:DUF427 domain-containing protein [Streptomyces sp. NPDC005438]|uniref:DUF427 domain-containing protein n=1 Tax=Streptomyces sp. NPDC005438 TaxID=3156880 RepID=UPI0033BE40F6